MPIRLSKLYLMRMTRGFHILRKMLDDINSNIKLVINGNLTFNLLESAILLHTQMATIETKNDIYRHREVHEKITMEDHIFHHHMRNDVPKPRDGISKKACLDVPDFYRWLIPTEFSD